MVNASLEDTAAMAMGADLNATLADSIEDELGVLRLEVVEALLDDMVAIEVLNEPNDLAVKGADDGVNLEVLATMLACDRSRIN